MGSPKPKTIKRLFAIAGNVCAFPKCTSPLIDEDSGSIIGEICHIKARRATGARYDSNQSDEQRNAYENLVLMCPTHHKIIDDDEESYTVERLQKIKVNQEKKAANKSGLILEKLEKFLEEHLSAIIEKDDFQKEADSQIITEATRVDSFLEKAQRRAKQREFKNFYNAWFDSKQSIKDIAYSVNEIFYSMEEKYLPYAETYTALGIKLSSRQSIKTIENDKFGCSVSIRNYNEMAHSLNSINPRLFVEIFLFDKKFIIPNYTYLEEGIERICLYPDINSERKLIWKDMRDETVIFTTKEICEICFELLITQIEKSQTIEV